MWNIKAWDYRRESYICRGHIYTWVMYACAPIHVCDMTHTCMWHDSYMYVTRLIHLCDMTHTYMRHDSYIYVTWLIHMWHDSYIYVTWLIHICDTTDTYMWHDCMYESFENELKIPTVRRVGKRWRPFIYMTRVWVICEWVMYARMYPHSRAGTCDWTRTVELTCTNISFSCTHICDMNHIHMYVTWLMHICDMPHIYIYVTCRARMYTYIFHVHIYVTWIVYTWLIHVTWLIYVTRLIYIHACMYVHMSRACMYMSTYIVFGLMWHAHETSDTHMRCVSDRTLDVCPDVTRRQHIRHTSDVQMCVLM